MEAHPLRPALAVLALVLPTLLVAAPAAGAEAAAVDAGATLAAGVDAAFPLTGHVEGFAGAATVAWAAPADCVVADPSSLSTTATCSAAGPRVFTLTATDGAQSASDTVRVEITRDVSIELLRTAGVGLVPQLNVVSLANRNFQVPVGLARMTAVADWEDNTPLREDFDIALTGWGRTYRATSTSKPETLTLESPQAGPWSIRADGKIAANTPYTLVVTGVVQENAVTFPTIRVAGAAASLGETVTLTARVEGAEEPATVAWELDSASRRFDDGAGESFSFTLESPGLVRAKLTDAAGREFVAEANVRVRGEFPLPLTVVAVIDSAYSPYHYDFLGSQHPWNLDADPLNDIDFDEHPASYVPGAPQATPLHITIPGGPDADVDVLRKETDAAAWASMEPSTSAQPRPYWFPGTKVVAALKFGNVSFESSNSAHGTRSAASAAGNLHGTCPECLVVLLNGNVNEAMLWATAQPWIDVITNSYGSGSIVQGVTGGYTRDNMYWRAPVEATRAASEAGQLIVFSAGNGLVNAYDAPQLTYWSSQKGPDWMVTVGAVSSGSKQTYSGSGKPVDISSIGDSYPSTGGSTADGTGEHGGTSNAAPTVAGFFAKVLQEAREALGDTTPGRANGLLAEGAPVACGSAVPDCALGDGKLTRVELERAVYANVLPSPRVVAIDLVWPSTEYAYYYQGHGTLLGRLAGDAQWSADWTRTVDHLKGEVAAHARPAGEESWFLVDSKCRQHLWGRWSGGLWQGTDPALDPVRDPLATSIDAWCRSVPEKVFLEVENRV